MQIIYDQTAQSLQGYQKLGAGQLGSPFLRCARRSRTLFSWSSLRVGLPLLHAGSRHRICFTHYKFERLTELGSGPTRHSLEWRLAPSRPSTRRPMIRSASRVIYCDAKNPKKSTINSRMRSSLPRWPPLLDPRPQLPTGLSRRSTPYARSLCKSSRKRWRKSLSRSRSRISSVASRYCRTRFLAVSTSNSLPPRERRGTSPQ